MHPTAPLPLLSQGGVLTEGVGVARGVIKDLKKQTVCQTVHRRLYNSNVFLQNKKFLDRTMLIYSAGLTDHEQLH